MNPIVSLVSGIFKPASDAYGKHVARKTARDTAKAKLHQSKVDNNHQLQLSQLEIEMLSKKNEENSWRDEYVTIIGTLPYTLIFLGAIASAFGFPEILEGVRLALQELEAMSVPVGDIILWTVLAGLGIRTFKRP